MKSSHSLILIVAFCLCGIAHSNVWDNMMSKTKASSPIVPEDSFNLDFDIKEYNAQGNFDFNNPLKLATLKISKDIVISELLIFQGQFSLNDFILTTDQMLTGCDKYQLDTNLQSKSPLPSETSSDENSVSDEKDEKQSSIDSSTLFLANMAFKFVGTSEVKGSGLFGKSIEYNMFEFAPNLNGKQSNLLDKLKEEKEAADKSGTLPGEIKDIEIDNFDIEEFNFVILCDKETGHIKKAFRNREMKEELKFNLASNVKEPISCNAKVQKVTKQFLQNLAKQAYENKDLYWDLIKPEE